MFVALTKCLTNLLTLTVANLLSGLVALPHSLIEGLLLEGDGTRLLKGFFTDLLLCGGELSDIGVVALLGVLVCALQDRVLLDGGHCLLLVHTTQPGVRVLLRAAEVKSSLHLAGAVPAQV